MPAGGNWKEMFHAAQDGDLELVGYHLRMGVDPNYQHPEYFTSALIESIRLGRLPVTRFLLDHGADPSIPEGFSTDTPLRIARTVDNPAAVRLLEWYLLPADQRPAPRKVLLTGGNRGIGRAIAESLLVEQHEVVLVVRRESEAQACVEALHQRTGNPHIHYLLADLSSIRQCRALVQSVRDTHPDIDTLINNAGVWMSEKKLNEDGLEMTFMVNYLAPHLLCEGLWSLLRERVGARIVNVNSALYRRGKLRADQTPYGRDFGSFHSYATSKLCNAMSTLDWAERLAETGVRVNAIHPGVIRTGLGDSDHWLSKLVKWSKRFWKAPTEGARGPVRLATSPDLDELHGAYYDELRPVGFHQRARDAKAREALRRETAAILQKANPS